MKRCFFHIFRVLCLATGGLWLLLCLWSWWFTGAYALCGVGVRLCGFGLWGILLSAVPLLFALPLVKPGGGLNWGAAMPAPLCVVLCTWVTVLWLLIPHPPGACADGGILAASGLLMALYMYGGGILLAFFSDLVQQLIRWFFTRK